MGNQIKNTEFLPIANVKLLKESLNPEEMKMWIEKKTEERILRLQLKYSYAKQVAWIGFVITLLKLLPQILEYLFLKFSTGGG